MTIVIGDTSDCAIGCFERTMKIGHTVTLQENKTRICRVQVSCESVSSGVPHKFGTIDKLVRLC